MKNALVEVSVIKSLGANCVNRDDLNAPKTVVFGGTTRARYSSQSKKHEMRNTEMFSELLGGAAKSIRTRQIYKPVLEQLKKEGVSEEVLESADKLLAYLGRKAEKDKDTKKKDGSDTPEKEDSDTKAVESGTGQIMAYSNWDIQNITEVLKSLISEDGEKNFCKKVSKQTSFNVLCNKLNDGVAAKGSTGINLDTALFGRMAATKSLTTVEASMQVAHAFSTNAIATESDFFVAVDDLMQNDGEQGSAMMGDVQYNTACYYEYTNLDVNALAKNLEVDEVTEADIREIVGKVVELFAITTPRGKQSTFAAYSLPSAIMVEVKSKKMPLNYANAFVKAVKPTMDKDIIEVSVDRLVAEVDKTEVCYDLGVIKRFWINLTGNVAPANCTVCTSLKEVVAGVVNTLTD